MFTGCARAVVRAAAGGGMAELGRDVEGEAGTGLRGWLLFFAAPGGTDVRSDMESDTGGERAGWLPNACPELVGEVA